MGLLSFLHRRGLQGVRVVLLLCAFIEAHAASPDSALPSLRTTVPLDGVWQISPIQVDHKLPSSDIIGSVDPISADGKPLDWSVITLPTSHGFYQDAPDNVFPQAVKKSYWFGVFRESTYNWAWYRRSFAVPSRPAHSRLFLSFMAIGWEAHIWVNGKPAGDHRGSFTGFDLDITDLLQPGAENNVTVLAITDFGERPMRHTYGKMFFPGANMGGIIGPVTLEIRPDVFVRRSLIAPNVAKSSITVEDWIENRTSLPETVQVSSVITGPDGTILNPGLGTSTVQAKPGITRNRHDIPVSKAPVWSVDTPLLCSLETTLSASGNKIDTLSSRFGFRSFTIENGRFLLNGHRVRLYYGNIVSFGQFDYSDPAGQDRFRQWLRRQKQQNVNTLRYHMGATDSALMLRICDEEGMLVIDEWPWFHRAEGAVAAGPSRDEFFRNVDAEREQWLYRDFNNPSNIIWSLSNEVWTKGDIPLLDHAYDQMKQLDWSERPISASSGFYSVIRDQTVSTDVVDFHNYSTQSEYPGSLIDERVNADFDTLKSLYNPFDKPVIISESLDIGAIPKVTVPQITPETYLAHANLKGVREIGLRAAIDPQLGTRYLVSTHGIRVLEQFRQDTRIQGFSPWFEDRFWLPDAIRQIYGPYYIGARDLPAHVGAGKPWTVKVVAIRDDLTAFDGQVSLQLVDAAGRTLWKQKTPVKIPAGQESLDQDVTWQVPATLAEGDATLSLDLQAQGKSVATRSYPVLLFPKEPLHLSIAAGRRVALFQTPGASPRLAEILAEAGVKVSKVSSFSKLTGIDVLILSNGWSAGTLPDLDALRAWLEAGGRIVAFESALETDIPWAPGFKLLHSSKTRQSFVDLVSPDHPIFFHLSSGCFDGWNGYGQLLTDTMIQPLSVNALAAAGSYGATGELATVMEAAVGKGSFLLTELEAVDHYDTDPAAARYVRNVLDYSLEGNPATVTPLAAVKKQNEILTKVAGTPPGQFAEVDLQAFANKPLVGTLGDVSTLDYSQLPVGEQSFLEIPFQIIDPAGNHGNAIMAFQGNYTPQLPQKMADIPIHSKATHLFFLQAAFHASSGLMGHYIVHYEDGTMVDIPLNGANLGDWFNPTDLKDASLAWSATPAGAAGSIGFYLFPWANPKPDKVIATLDVQSEGAEQESGASLLLAGITFRKP